MVSALVPQGLTKMSVFFPEGKILTLGSLRRGGSLEKGNLRPTVPPSSPLGPCLRQVHASQKEEAGSGGWGWHSHPQAFPASPPCVRLPGLANIGPDSLPEDVPGLSTGEWPGLKWSKGDK